MENFEVMECYRTLLVGNVTTTCLHLATSLVLYKDEVGLGNVVTWPNVVCPRNELDNVDFL